jgi:hypothetical protein
MTDLELIQSKLSSVLVKVMEVSLNLEIWHNKNGSAPYLISSIKEQILQLEKEIERIKVQLYILENRK